MRTTEQIRNELQRLDAQSGLSSTDLGINITNTHDISCFNTHLQYGFLETW